MLIVSSWSEQFRSDIGLNGVSQVWGTRPAWYFWLDKSPGVYQLEMMTADEALEANAAYCRACFRIKCYPFPDREEFASFSFQERNMVKSTLFDDTNTPRFEHQDDIPIDLFTVATLSIITGLEGNVAIFCLESMACLRTRYILETHQYFPLLNQEHIVKEKEIDRAVPGFQVGYRLFDCLMSLYANTHKLAPCEVAFTQTTGYEVVSNGSHIDAYKTDATKGYDLRVLFGTDDAESLHDDSDEMRTLDAGDEKCIYRKRFNCGHYHPLLQESKSPISLNPQWWSLAHQHYESELASTCGCH